MPYASLFFRDSASLTSQTVPENGATIAKAITKTNAIFKIVCEHLVYSQSPLDYMRFLSKSKSDVL